MRRLKLHHPQKPVAYARVFGLLGLGSRCGGRKEEQQGKFIRDLGCRSWGAEKRAGGECSCGGCAESCRGLDGGCDAMRCDAMRCDSTRCDAIDERLGAAVLSKARPLNAPESAALGVNAPGIRGPCHRPSPRSSPCFRDVFGFQPDKRFADAQRCIWWWWRRLGGTRGGKDAAALCALKPVCRLFSFPC